MTALNLTEEEVQLLGEVMHSRLASLEIEILHTDHADYRRGLKQRREILESIARKLPRVPEMAS